ncbi:MAG: hypothetical protein ACKVIN_16320 [Longimicrobiales bacterium]|jgi:hypothetical protein
MGLTTLGVLLALTVADEGRQDSGLARLSVRVLTGEDHLRGRAEVALTASFGSVFLFSDYGWAGSLGAFELDNGFYSVGAGTSLLDGLFRIDAGYGLKDPRGFRLDFYLDAIL